MIQLIKQIITDLGIEFRYGNPAQINEYLQHVDYSATAGGVAAYCYLLTDTEYTNGKEGGNVAVFFSTLIDFDFDGQQALNTTDICKAKAKEFLQKVAESNLIRYEGARFQYGYDDFAENVAWCAVRAYFEDMVPDCQELIVYPTKVLTVIIGTPTPGRVDFVVLTNTKTEFPLSVYVDDVETVYDINYTDILESSNPPWWYDQFTMSEYVGRRFYECRINDMITIGTHTLQAVVSGVASPVITIII